MPTTYSENVDETRYYQLTDPTTGEVLSLVCIDDDVNEWRFDRRSGEWIEIAGGYLSYQVDSGDTTMDQVTLEESIADTPPPRLDPVF